MKNLFIPIALIFLLFTACQTDLHTWSTEDFHFSIDAKGLVNNLVDTETEIDYLNSQEASPLLQLRVENEYHWPTTFEAMEEGFYKLNFEAINTEVVIKIDSKANYIRLAIEEIKGPADIEVAVWGPFQNTISQTIGEIVGVARDTSFALGIQALNIRTLGGFPSLENDQDKAYDIFETNSIVDVSDSVKVLYRGQTVKRTDHGSSIQAYVRNRDKERIIANWNHDKYVAPAFEDEGIKGSAIALFGTHPKKALATIGEIEIAEGLPHPMIDGEWGKTQHQATASYLIMNFGEETLDEAMALTHKAGLKYLYHGGPFVNWGHFDLNPSEFPNNWASMKNCVERAKKEGLKLGLHTLSNFITTNDPYVTPVPDPRLAKVGESRLSNSVSKTDSEIQIEAPDFFNQMKNNTLHTVVVNGELIRYRTVSTEAPWTLLDCERGAFGTSIKDHEKGAPIAKLMDHGYKTFLSSSELSTEIALQLAKLYNETGLRQISFDGLEGTWSSGMGQYARQLFVQTWYDALHPEHQGEIITDASNPGHFFWHSYTRMNWGEPWYAGFRESQTQYRLLNQAFYQRNLMPSMLGWFRMTPEISLEDIEWLLARSAGFDAGFALVTSPGIVDIHGKGEEIMRTIKNWEEARMADVFPEHLKPALQDISKEFHLEPNGPNSWTLFSANLVKGVYENRIKQPGEPNQLKLDFKNENPDQPMALFLSTAKESGISNLTIEIDNYKKVLIPIDIPANHHLKYTGGSYIYLYTNTWELVAKERVIQDQLWLTQGEHKILLEGGFSSDDGDLKVEIRTYNPGDLLK